MSFSFLNQGASNSKNSKGECTFSKFPKANDYPMTAFKGEGGDLPSKSASEAEPAAKVEPANTLAAISATAAPLATAVSAAPASNINASRPARPAQPPHISSTSTAPSTSAHHSVSVASAGGVPRRPGGRPEITVVEARPMGDSWPGKAAPAPSHSQRMAGGEKVAGDSHKKSDSETSSSSDSEGEDVSHVPRPAPRRTTSGARAGSSTAGAVGVGVSQGPVALPHGERLRILQMVKDGKITQTQAIERMQDAEKKYQQTYAVTHVRREGTLFFEAFLKLLIIIYFDCILCFYLSLSLYIYI